MSKIVGGSVSRVRVPRELIAVGNPITPRAHSIPDKLRDQRPKVAPVIIILSGCTWDCTGGAQRPVALAREFAKGLYNVGYWTQYISREGCFDGVQAFSGASFDALVEWAGDAPGWVLYASPICEPQAEVFRAKGWRTIYDMIDNWDAFAARGDLVFETACDESATVRGSALVTCSAPSLVRRAQELGRPDAHLILNGGPDPVEPDRGDGLLVGYCGGMTHSWFDWRPVEALSGAGIRVLMIGRAPHGVEYPGVEFVGELPHAEALRLLATTDVGIIPFQHADICHYVDPVKAYDYWAVGNWCVVTPDLTPMQDRPFTLTALAHEFPDACRRAAAETERPSAKFVAAHTWAARARTFEGHMAAYEKPREEKPVRISWMAPTVCKMEPRCPYCATRFDRKTSEEDGVEIHEADFERWVQGFVQLTETRDIRIAASFGEPFDLPLVPRILAEVIRRSAGRATVNFTTSIRMPLSALVDMPHDGSMSFSASFHPHYWKSVQPFAEKIAAIEEAGIPVEIASVVTYPPYLPYVRQWATEFAKTGKVMVISAYQGEWGGKWYPDAYTPEEREIIYGSMEMVYGPDHSKSLGEPCWAGRDYLGIDTQGNVTRCHVEGMSPMGNILTDRIELYRTPEPCTYGNCGCPDLWYLQTRVGAN